MAVPTVYANNPVAGSIAWDAFNIQFNGTTYAIGAGNTTNRWVWWRYNTGGVTTVIEAGPDVPDGQLVNQILNPGFELVDATDATLPQSWVRPVPGGLWYSAAHTETISTAQYTTGTQSIALAIGATGLTAASIQQPVQLVPGTTVRVTFRAKGSNAMLNGVYAMLINTAGTAEIIRFTSILNLGLTTAWQVFSGTLVVPVGATAGRLLIMLTNRNPGEVMYVDDVEFGVNPATGLVDNDLVLFGNKNGVPFRVQGSSFIDGDLLIDGSVAVKALSAEVIMAGQVYTNEVYTGLINSTQIYGSNINADLVVSGKMKTAETGQRMELSRDGLKQFGSDGVSLRVFLPNDTQQSSLIDAIILARGLTVSQGMEVRGQSTFAMGSKTILQTQTVGATSGPSLGTDYPLSSFARGQWCDPHYGLHLDSAESSGSHRTSNTFFDSGLIRKGTNFWRAPRVPNSSGDTNNQYTFEVSTAIAVGGAERHVTRALFRDPGYVGARDEKMMITSWDDSTMVGADSLIAPVKKVERQDGNFSWFWQWPIGRCFSVTGNTRAHMVAQAKRNMWFAWPGGDVALSTLAFTDTTITPSAVKTIASSFFQQDENLVGVTYGSSQRMGFSGADQDVWVLHGTVNNYVFNDAASPVRQPDLEFPAVPATRSVGACGDLLTGAFTRWTVAPATDGPQYYNYTPITWTSTDSPIWWGTFTWYDSAGTIQESNASIFSSITMKKRARLTVTVPDLPDPATGRGTARTVNDVNSFRFYLTRMSTTPLRTDFIKQTQQPADLATVLAVDAPIFTGGTGPPPVATTFVAAAPASIESNAAGTGGIPKIKLTGDGYAHVEDLDVGTSVAIGGAGATSLSGKAFDQLYYSIRAQSQLTGGGIKSVDATYNISWSSRFLMMSLGNSLTLATTGYFQVDMPPIGTVISGYGGASSKTVVTAGIPLADWDSLWYEIPYGQPSGSVSSNFRITNYTGTFTVPNNWILIATRNTDRLQIEWATGENVEPGFTSLSPTKNYWSDQATGNLTCTTATWTVVPGVSIVVPSRGPSDVFLCNPTMDAECQTAGTLSRGLLYIDGVGHSSGRQIVYRGTGAGFRATVGQSYVVTGLSAGNHTIDLRCSLASASGSYIIQTQTTLQITRV